MKLEDDVRQHMRQWLHEYIDSKCIYRVKPDEELLPAKYGNYGYSWLILSRIGLMNGKFLNYVGFLFWDLFYEDYCKQPFQISGLETACIPIISSIAITAPFFGIEDLNCFYARKSPKEFGLFQTFEGNIKKYLPTVIVDDFYNSKSTYMICKEKLKKEGVKIHNKAFAIIDNDESKFIPNDILSNKELRSKANEALENMEIVSLFKITDFNLTYFDLVTKKYKEELKRDLIIN